MQVSQFWFASIIGWLLCNCNIHNNPSNISQYKIVTCSVTSVTGVHMWSKRCHRWLKRCHLWRLFCHMCTPVTLVTKYETVLYCNILEGFLFTKDLIHVWFVHLQLCHFCSETLKNSCFAVTIAIPRSENTKDENTNHYENEKYKNICLLALCAVDAKANLQNISIKVDVWYRIWK